MIELQAISKEYGSKVALAPTTYTFSKGRTTALIGPSGCGKSTLLRLIIGLIAPTSGRLAIDGEFPDSWLQMRRRMGYVVQDGGLFPHLSARSNVVIMAEHLRREPTATEDRLSKLCELTKFPPDALGRFPAELSGGQRQRLSLMRALFLEPDYLLLDEPLAALDPMVRSGLQQDLKEIFQELSQTVIFVTHDMAEAGFLADQIVLMNEGSIVQAGSLDQLRDEPASPFVRAFMNAQRSLVSI
jgi:osmoprotectant transport system ATP-binding protein